MLIFTGVDKALLDRAARLMEIRADAMYEAAGGNWGATKESRKAKDEYDVLMRDARDLRALGKRLLGKPKQKGRAVAAEQPPLVPPHVESIPS